MGNERRMLMLGQEIQTFVVRLTFVLIHFCRRFPRDLSDQTLLLPITALLAPPSVANLQPPAYVVSFIPCREAQHDYHSQEPRHPLRRWSELSDSGNLLLRRLFALSVEIPSRLLA